MHEITSIIDTAAMSNKRLNITLPEELIKKILAVPNKSKFIAEAIREKIDRQEKEALDALLCEGYQATRAEDREINEDWEPATLEKWD
jgi:metal-responsive CopG/Arc/MetJ family transcriptional regulator